MSKRALLLSARTLGLDYSANDQELMKECLEKNGYEVAIATPVKSAFVDVFDGFIDSLSETDTVIFYYSGHGYTPQGRLTFALNDDLQSSRSRLDIDYITDAFENSRAKNKLIILDCCRSSALGKEWTQDPSDRFRILTASERLQPGKELENLKASFLTYMIHRALMTVPAEIVEGNSITLSLLYEWLVKQAKGHNQANPQNEVPIPNLMGNQKNNFRLADFADNLDKRDEGQKENLRQEHIRCLNGYLSWIVRLHSTLELRGIRKAGVSPALPLEKIFVALKADYANPTERAESRMLAEEEYQRYLSESENEDLTEDETRRLRWRFLSSSPLMPSLEQRDRPHLFTTIDNRPVNLAEAFCRNRWLVILGDPGSGKTTVSRWLALKFAQAYLKADQEVIVPANQVSVDTITEDTTSLGPTRVPILVRVSDFAQARQKSEIMLSEYLGYQPWLGEFPTFGKDAAHRSGERISPEQLNLVFKNVLRDGKAIVILDGLDEITEADERNEIVKGIEVFIRDWIRTPEGRSPFEVDSWLESRKIQQDITYPAMSGGNQIVITSRIAGYHIAPLGGNLIHTTIQPMNDDAISHFCSTWTESVHKLLADPGDSSDEIALRAKQEAQSLRDTIFNPDRPGVRELAGNPLLLAVLALVHHNSQARLPEQRVRLYQIAVENLIEVWRDSGLTEDEVVHVLSPLAAHIHDRYSTGLIEQSELRKIITINLARYRSLNEKSLPPAFHRDVDLFLQALRERVGLLAARGEYLFGFLHLTFQEYLAARFLVRDPDTAREELASKIGDPRWREPILLAIGYISFTWGPEARERLIHSLLDIEDPLGDIFPRALLLIAAALPELVHKPPRIISNVVSRLLKTYAQNEGWIKENILTKQVEQTLISINRGDMQEAVANTFIEILQNADRDSQIASACIYLLAKHHWFSPQIVELILKNRKLDNREWDWCIERSLRTISINNPLLLQDHLIFKNLALSNSIPQELIQHPRFRDLVMFLYGAWDNWGRFSIYNSYCDSILTPLLAGLIRNGTESKWLENLTEELAYIVTQEKENDKSFLDELDFEKRTEALLALLVLSADPVNELKKYLVGSPNSGMKNRVLARFEAFLAVSPNNSDLLSLNVTSAKLIDTFGVPSQGQALWNTLLDPERRSIALHLIEEDSTTDLILGQLEVDTIQAMITRGYHDEAYSILLIATDILSLNTNLEIPLTWVDFPDGQIAQQASRLLAKNEVFSIRIFNHLLALLAGADDRSRYAVMETLNSTSLSVLKVGKEMVEAVAKSLIDQSDNPPLATTIYTFLVSFIHDDIDALIGWCVEFEKHGPNYEVARTILQSAKKITGEALSSLRTYILSASQELQLLFLMYISHPFTDSMSINKTIRRFKNEKTRLWAVKHFGSLKNPTRSEIRNFLKLIGKDEATDYAVLDAMVFLFYRGLNPEFVPRVEECLQEKLEQKNNTRLLALMIRLWIISSDLYQSIDEGSIDALAHEIIQKLLAGREIKESSNELEGLLLAILESGSNYWKRGRFHFVVVTCAKRLVESNPALIKFLLRSFHETLLDPEDWIYKEILIAAIAAVAEMMPAAFARCIDAQRTRDLIAASNNKLDFLIRKYALTAISFTRTVSADVAQGIWNGLQDVSDVHTDVIEAVKRFRKIDSQFIPVITKGLENPSAVVAYSTAQILEAIGVSDSIHPPDRLFIIDKLAAAIRSKLALRKIFLQEKDAESEEISTVYKGILRDEFLYVLMRIAGLVKGDLKISEESLDQQTVPESTLTSKTALDVPLYYRTSYELGNDLYDDSFSIDSPSGEFLGECGMGISETIGVSDPKKVTAFEVWLFDKNDIQTVTKVLMSTFAFSDPVISQHLASKGEPVQVELGKRILLETETLRLEARVMTMSYGSSSGELPVDSYFNQITFDLFVSTKPE